MADPLLPHDPRALGHYQLTGRLGVGGFGVVYAATDSTGQPVAVKRLKDEFASNPDIRVRLAREGRAMRRVDSERVARIAEVVTDGDDAYLVMELVDGNSLDRHIASNGPLRGPELWFAATGLAEALQAIHRAGIVHRDLKPANVMYGPDGLKVLDFGISTITEDSPLTRTGTFLATAAWVSPEQIRAERATQASDVFVLGLVLAYAATGLHPFGAGRADAVMFRIAHEGPSLESITEPFLTVISACLNKDPAQRPTIDALNVFFTSGGTDGLLIGDSAGPQDTTVVTAPPAVTLGQATIPDRPTPSQSHTPPDVTETADPPPQPDQPETIAGGATEQSPDSDPGPVDDATPWVGTEVAGMRHAANGGDAPPSGTVRPQGGTSNPTLPTAPPAEDPKAFSEPGGRKPLGNTGPPGLRGTSNVAAASMASRPPTSSAAGPDEVESQTRAGTAAIPLTPGQGEGPPTDAAAEPERTNDLRWRAFALVSVLALLGISGALLFMALVGSPSATGQFIVGETPDLAANARPASQDAADSDDGLIRNPPAGVVPDKSDSEAPTAPTAAEPADAPEPEPAGPAARPRSSVTATTVRVLDDAVPDTSSTTSTSTTSTSTTSTSTTSTSTTSTSTTSTSTTSTSTTSTSTTAPAATNQTPPPPASTNFAGHNTSVAISWTAPDSPLIGGFLISWGPNGASARLGRTARNHTFFGLPCEGNFSYTIRSVSPDGTRMSTALGKNFTTFRCVDEIQAPTTPTGFSATPLAAAIRVCWTVVNDPVPPDDVFLQWGSPSDPYNAVTLAPASGCYTITGLVPGERYSISLRARLWPEGVASSPAHGSAVPN